MKGGAEMAQNAQMTSVATVGADGAGHVQQPTTQQVAPQQQQRQVVQQQQGQAGNGGTAQVGATRTSSYNEFAQAHLRGYEEEANVYGL